MVRKKPIYSFDGNFAFLSNFHPSTVVVDGKIYPSVEAAYQALKTHDKYDREKIRLAKTPRQAKKLGRTVKMRKDWWKVKVGIMRELVFQKFLRNTDLKKKLLATGTSHLVEGNTWNDRFWGICNGGGYNHLGKILMEVRETIRKKENV